MKHKLKLIVEEIERKNYHLFIELMVKTIPCRLLVDTGASKTVFDSERILRFVDLRQIEVNDGKSVGLGVSEMETQVATLKKITVGQLSIRKMEVAVLPIAHVNTTYRQLNIPEIDGVLGSDFLMKYEAVINYEKRTLTLHKKK